MAASTGAPSPLFPNLTSLQPPPLYTVVFFPSVLLWRTFLTATATTVVRLFVVVVVAAAAERARALSQGFSLTFYLSASRNRVTGFMRKTRDSFFFAVVVVVNIKNPREREIKNNWKGTLEESAEWLDFFLYFVGQTFVRKWTFFDSAFLLRLHLRRIWSVGVFWLIRLRNESIQQKCDSIARPAAEFEEDPDRLSLILTYRRVHFGVEFIWSKAVRGDESISLSKPQLMPLHFRYHF